MEAECLGVNLVLGMWEKRCFGYFSEVSDAEEATEMSRQILSYFFCSAAVSFALE